MGGPEILLFFKMFIYTYIFLERERGRRLLSDSQKVQHPKKFTTQVGGRGFP